MALTLNGILARLRSLAESHAQLRTFYFGDPHEFDEPSEGEHTDIVYPACFVHAQPGTIDRKEHLINFNFKIYFYDLVKVSQGTENNETEVLSDMSGVAQDFMAMLMYSGYQRDWIIKDLANFDLKTEQLNDMVAGVVVDVQIGVDFLADRCQVPAEDVTFETLDMARTRIYTYDGTGLEGATLDVSFLSGKYVLAAWRAGFYKRVVITTPDDSEEIQVGTVDAGLGKGIVSSGSAVLQAGDALLSGEKVDFLYYS